MVIYLKKFKISKIYYEPEVPKYALGKKLLKKYSLVPQIQIQSHNNIPELREYSNKDFVKLKTYLILGVRKSLRWVPNNKISDYLVPFTSSGCMAMCLYCYLVCNYNKCSYLRVFVNREEIMDNIVKKVNKADTDLVLEIGSNSDLILEETITSNLSWTIKEFVSRTTKGKLTFPTKFCMVDSILNLDHQGRIIPRMSINPKSIIKTIELGTSNLDERIEAINKLADAGYPVGILIAPVIFVDNWKKLYKDLVIYLNKKLSEKAKEIVFFEVIFMTYSFIHNAINTESFPNSPVLMNKELMKSRGKGKYTYKNELKAEGTLYISSLLKKHFKDNEIKYIV